MLSFDDYVIYTCLHSFADLLFQACLNHVLVGCAGILEPERHSVEAEGPIGSDECRCGLVGFFHLNLMVSGVCVEETQRVMSCSGVDDLIDAREGKGILGASLVEVF